ncbi:MAG: metalloregulator ArsR/SmtB family transcription factor [Chromatiales bacterium]|jgi:DNA-binding transcriptional ArsR family regulator
MDVFQVVADPTRRRLLDLLAEGEQPVQSLATHFSSTLQAVSQHLKTLQAADLVRSRKDGRFRYYRVNPSGLREMDAWLERYRVFWNGRLARLGRHLDEQP